MTPKHITVLAGEQSGDMRAAGLIRELKKSLPSLRVTGIGGENMRAAGTDTFCDITELAVIGFTDVIRNYGRIREVFYRTFDIIKKERPDAVIMVDYPGFNLRLAKKLHREGIKVIYYISPQVWAWKEKRVHLIKKIVKRMMVLFPFEIDFYKKHDFNADFVGHPLLDEIEISKNRDQLLDEFSIAKDKPVIALLPGSRNREIERHLSVMIEAAEKIHKHTPASFILLKSPTISLTQIQQYTKDSSLDIHITENYYSGINACDTAIVSSGTATLETAILEKPMVVLYKTSWLTWELGKFFIKIPYIALVNVIAGQMIVPELLQEKASAQSIYEETLRYLQDKSLYQATVDRLIELKKKLGETGASRRAAEVVLEEIN